MRWRNRQLSTKKNNALEVGTHALLPMPTCDHATMRPRARGGVQHAAPVMYASARATTAWHAAAITTTTTIIIIIIIIIT